MRKVITVYGIKNCDTVKKALKWLIFEGVEHSFHDYRKDGLERAQLEGWVKELGMEIVLNKRGTTWRKLADEDKDGLSEDQVIDLLMENPAMIKRPIMDFGSVRTIGFAKKDQEQIAQLLGLTS